jgi:hypothetical protein
MPLPSYTYSGAVYSSPTVGTATFNLTTAGGSAIGFVDPSHIKVYTTLDNGSTLIERFRPAQWEFNTARTQVTLVVPTVLNESVVIRRITPITSLLTSIPDGINLPAERLQSLQLANLYVAQETAEANAVNAQLAADTAAQSSLILATVASQLAYTLYAARANVPANPGSAISAEVLDSTNIQTFTPLSGIPSGFVGSSSLIVRIRYSVGLATWQWVDYRPISADLRYLLKTQIVNSVISSSATDPASANAAKTAYDAAVAAQTANTSLAAVVSSIQAATSTQYTALANIAAIPASPANGNRVEVTNSLGIESFTPLAGRPAGFIGSSALSVRLLYSTVGSTWNWIDYKPVDPDVRYTPLSVSQSGTGALSRTVQSKLTDYPSILDYSTLAQALTANNSVELPPGVFLLTSELAIPRDALRICGAGAGRTIIRCASSMASGHAFVLAGRNNCAFQDFSLDCNSTARSLSAGSGYNGFNVQGNGNSWLGVEVYGAPLYGILIDGNSITSTENLIERCYIKLNGGTGVALNKANQTKINNNRFNDNGYENLTVDINSTGNMVTGNHFLKHRGGCGNVGWDDSDASIFANNYINSENTTVPALGTRNGLVINSESGVTTGAVIEGNIIINCNQYGLILRNRSGEANPSPPPNWNPSKPGDAMISGNYLRNNLTADIRIEDTNEIIALGYNNYQTMQIADPDASNIRIPAGDASAEVYLTATQSISGNAFTTVAFDTTAALRLITASGGVLTLPCGGFYTINTKVRVNLLATGITSIQLRVVTPSGNRVVNAVVPSGQTVTEVGCSITKFMAQGSVRVEVYPFGTGTVQLSGGSENWFTVTSAG